jgi:hypothetical protein
MHFIRATLALSVVLAILGCESKKDEAATGAATASTPAAPSATAPVTNAEVPRQAPADVDVTPFIKNLKCDQKSKLDSCRILNEFAEGVRFIAQTPSGEGRWIGNAYVREKGKETKQLLLLWAKQVPTSQVGPGDLPIRVGNGTLDESLVEHGFKMVNALSRSDQPSKHNQARSAVDSFVPATQRGAVNTAGASVRLISEESIYLRQSGRKVLMFTPNQAQSATLGDGTYAEFWRATW